MGTRAPRLTAGGATVSERLAWVLGAVALVMLLGITPATALTIPVTAPDGTQVGEVRVHIAPDLSGVMGAFVSSYGDPPSLAAAAAACGEHHFNWYQLVMSDNMPPNGPDGKPLTAPYWDPPFGGYGPPDRQWADNLPWYWDEGADPPRGTPGFYDGLHLDDNLHDRNGDGVKEVLGFNDFPSGPLGTEVVFQTWLVSLNEDGSLHSFHGGFAWSWTNPDDGDWGGGRWPWPLGMGIATLDEGQTPLTPEQGLAAFRQSIPDPGSLTLLVLGLCGALAARRRRMA